MKSLFTALGMMVLLSLSVVHAADHSDGSIAQETPAATPMRGAENHPIKDPGVARNAAKKKVGQR